MRKQINLTKYVACICEGGAEWVIINKLLDSNSLIFKREDLIDSRILPRMKAKDFAEKFLNVDYSDKLTVLRIIDSPREKFNVPKQYKDKVNVVDVLTTPEIEMLVICNKGVFADFKKEQNKSKCTPSRYCKEKLGIKNIKTKKFVSKYFNNSKIIVDSIKEYYKNSYHNKERHSLYDILKSKQ